MKTLFILLLTVSSCFAQQSYKGRITKYFDKDWKTITDASAASYFRTVEEMKRKYVVRDYFISGAIQMEAECEEYRPKLERDGKNTVYYESGQVKEQCIYNKNKIDGEFLSFYENGKPKENFTYSSGSVVKYNHIFSPEGIDYLSNGTGTAPKSPESPTPSQYSEYLNHTVVGSFMIEKSDTTYLMVEKPAEYPGGVQQLGKDIGQRLTYPTSARRSGHQGKVFIVFTIQKNGEVIDHAVVKGFHPDCDAEAFRMVKTLTPWVPGEHHGKKVKSKFVLPINFRLQ